MRIGAALDREGGKDPMVQRKRDEERRRRNKPAVETKRVEPDDDEVKVPAGDPNWYPAALRWYDSLARSAMSIFYEEADWETAWLLAEQLSRELKPQPIGVHPETGKAVVAKIPIKPASLTAFLKGCSALLVTEGDRRRAHIEIERRRQRGVEPDANSLAAQVSSLDRRRGRLAG